MCTLDRMVRKGLLEEGTFGAEISNEKLRQAFQAEGAMTTRPRTGGKGLAIQGVKWPLEGWDAVPEGEVTRSERSRS